MWHALFGKVHYLACIGEPLPCSSQLHLASLNWENTNQIFWQFFNTSVLLYWSLISYVYTCKEFFKYFEENLPTQKFEKLPIGIWPLFRRDFWGNYNINLTVGYFWRFSKTNLAIWGQKYLASLNIVRVEYFGLSRLETASYFWRIRLP